MNKSGKYRLLTVVVVAILDLLFLNLLFIALRHSMGLMYSSQVSTEWAQLGDANPMYIVLQVWINLGYLLAYAMVRVNADMARVPLRMIISNALYRCLIMSAIVLLCLFSIKMTSGVSRLFLTVYFTSAFFMLVLLHALLKRLMRVFVKRGWYASATAIILGAGDMGYRVFRELRNNTSLGIKVLGLFDDDPDKSGPLMLGTMDDVVNYVEANKVDHIYCTLPLSAKDKIVYLMNYAENHIVQFHIIPAVRYYSEAPLVMNSLVNLPVLSVREIPLGYVHNALLKRVFDVAISSIFLFTVFPFVYLILGAIIKLSSPGPVFFVQTRTGRNGSDFKCYKFRSMRQSNDANTKQATSDDPRKTKIGDFMRRTNLDELPQFINVLKGDMSIVGPRPHMVKHTSEYSPIVDKYMVRHFIKPGITGWAQVTGSRGETKEVEQMEERIKKDIWYIENWSIYLDFEIVIRTVTTTLKGDKQAY